ncbi:MAG: hypothetical protein ABJA70_18205 [Chryseolinea sp.]
MKQQELEDQYIRSLDVPMNNQERERFLTELRAHPTFVKELNLHSKVRELVTPKAPASFGPYFASKLIHKIENTGVVIDRQIFSFFKRFQLAALGIAVALLILNVMFADQANLKSVFGLDRTPTTTTDEEIISFDFYETLNNDL